VSYASPDASQIHLSFWIEGGKFIGLTEDPPDRLRIIAQDSILTHRLRTNILATKADVSGTELCSATCALRIGHMKEIIAAAELVADISV
jgi:hypothetical protein